MRPWANMQQKKFKNRELNFGFLLRSNWFISIDDNMAIFDCCIRNGKHC